MSDDDLVAVVTEYLFGSAVAVTIVEEGDDEPWFGDSFDVASYGVQLLPRDEAEAYQGSIEDDETEPTSHHSPTPDGTIDDVWVENTTPDFSVQGGDGGGSYNS